MGWMAYHLELHAEHFYQSFTNVSPSIHPTVA